MCCIPLWPGGGLCVLLSFLLTPKTRLGRERDRWYKKRSPKAERREEREGGVNETKLKLGLCLSVLQLSSGAVPKSRHFIVFVNY